MPDVNEILGRYGIDPSMKPDPEVAAKFGKAPGSLAPPAPASAAKGGALPPNVASILGRYGISTDEPAKVDNSDPVSVAESIVRGHIQGRAGGFAEEAAAGIETAASKIPLVRNVAQLFQPEGSPRVDDPNVTYAERRDFKRGQYRKAHDDNPVAYTAGELTGSLGAAIPGSLLARGAGVGIKALAKRAAVEGAVSALGNSEADLTKGDFAGAATDAATGAAIGGVVGGALGAVAKKLTRGAESRMVKDIVQEVTSGEGGVRLGNKAATGVRRDATDIADTLLKPENKPILKLKAAGKTEDAQAFIARRQDELGTTVREPAYEAFDAKVGGFRVGDLTEALEKRVDELGSSPGNQKLKSSLGAALKDIRESWGTTVDPGTLGADKLAGAVKEFDPNRMIPTLDLRKFTTGVQQSAVETNDFSAAAKIKNFLRDEVQDVLNKHLDDGVKANKDLGDVVDRIRAYNTESSALSNVARALKPIAEKEQSRSPGLGGVLHAAVGHGGMLAAGGAALMGHPEALLAPIAIKAGVGAAKKTAQATNMALAKLMRSALNGSTKAQIMQQAIEEGIPEATAMAIAAKWSQPGAAEEP